MPAFKCSHVVLELQKHPTAWWPHLNTQAKGVTCFCFTLALSIRCRDNASPGRKIPKRRGQPTNASHFEVPKKKKSIHFDSLPQGRESTGKKYILFSSLCLPLRSCRLYPSFKALLNSPFSPPPTSSPVPPLPYGTPSCSPCRKSFLLSIWFGSPGYLLLKHPTGLGDTNTHCTFHIPRRSSPSGLLAL